MAWTRLSWRIGAAGLAALAFTAIARAEPAFAPENATRTVEALRLRCALSLTCPIDSALYAALSRAVEGEPDAQYRVAEILEYGRGVVRDERSAIAWYGKAAEQGHVAAALNGKRHGGEAIEADEGKIATALAAEVDKGNPDAMRALADMAVYGRGVPRSADRGLQLLQRAADKGSADAEADLARLYMIGAPGILQNAAEGIRWQVASGRHGNLEAMYGAGMAYLHTPDTTVRDPVEGYRWLMRAALLDYPRAQESLSGVVADGVMVGARVVIAPDPVQADMWFRLAARSPFFDNPNIRYHIETKMDSAQLSQAKKLAADWRPLKLAEVLAMTLDPPPVAGAKRPWPPGLMGPALEAFKDAGDNPEPWQRLPDFDRIDAVRAAIGAIAEHCERNGQTSCARYCRQRLDDISPPVKPGGLSPMDVAKYLVEHPNASSAAAMRKEQVTADQAMQSWVICANQVADRP